MQKLIDSISDDQYEIASEKFLEFNAFKKQQKLFGTIFNKNIDIFTMFSVHHESRSPWVLNNPKKKAKLELIFTKNTPENDQIVTCTNQSIVKFIYSIFICKEDLIYSFMRNTISISEIEFNSCKINSDVFISTFIIPAVFGHFLGTKNVLSFIDAVGCGFDALAHDEENFIKHFDGSFLYFVLRQFFFSSIHRTFYGEQFTCFLDLFAHVKHQVDSQYGKIQRFFNAFVCEFREALKSPSSFLIHSLFVRISEKFKDKFSLVLTVLFHCIIIPMVENPVSYGVLPLNFSMGETEDFVPKLKGFLGLILSAKRGGGEKNVYFSQDSLNVEKAQTPHSCAQLAKKTAVMGRSTSEFSLGQANVTYTKRRSVPEINLRDIHVEEFVNDVLQKVDGENVFPEISFIVLPFKALQFLFEFYKTDLDVDLNYLPTTILKLDASTLPSMLSFLPAKTIDIAPPPNSEEIEMLISIFDIENPNSAKARVLKKNFEIKSRSNPQFNFDSIIEELERLMEKQLESITEIQGMIKVTEKLIIQCKRAIERADSIFVNKIVENMFNDTSLMNEIRQKKSAMLAEPSVFSDFVISHLDSFAIKNRWASVFMRQIARKFHSLLVTTNFTLHDFISNAESQENSKNPNITEYRDLSKFDQKFLNNKLSVLSVLEQNGLDDNVKKILASNGTFNAAQTTILRACLLEIPIESAKQIVVSFNTVEDIFSFVFGVRPEANQLMPLIANLFILSPVPNPLSFAQWLKHFLKLLMEKKPEWFSDESMRPLEHYFTFGQWMKEILMSVED